MVPNTFSYHKPGTVQEALGLLQQFEDDCKILAGGHSLIPVMKLRLSDPENLIDITGIGALRNIQDDGESISIGACATHGAIARHEGLQQHAPLVAKAASMIGDVQVRNFGTIGGSIAHADPAADWPPVLIAAGAKIAIQSQSGSREIDAEQFFKGLFMTDLEETELITTIHIPKTAANRNSTYVKFAQPASRFALVGCAVALEMNGRQVTQARVAFGGVSAKPFRDSGIEAALQGQALNSDNIGSATAEAAAGVSIMEDHFANQAYRKHLAGVYARRALAALA